MLTVSETAIHPPDEEGSNALNSPKSLSLEATYINHNFAQQVCDVTLANLLYFMLLLHNFLKTTKLLFR